MYLRLDRELARLFEGLDELVGEGEWTAFLTADHGGANVPSHMASLKMPTDYWKPGNMMDALSENLNRRYGRGDWILRHSNDQIFLNHELLNKRKVDRDDMARYVAQRCSVEPGLSQAVAACDVTSLACVDPVAERLVRGHRPGHSGDVLLVPQPGWIDYGRTGTTHGSAFPHDTHVPALLLGKGIRPGQTFERTFIRDLAPTLAHILQSPYPNGTTGSPIIDALQD